MTFILGNLSSLKLCSRGSWLGTRAAFLSGMCFLVLQGKFTNALPSYKQLKILQIIHSQKKLVRI